jgi:hypothetical protein
VRVHPVGPIVHRRQAHKAPAELGFACARARQTSVLPSPSIPSVDFNRPPPTSDAGGGGEETQRLFLEGRSAVPPPRPPPRRS